MTIYNSMCYNLLNGQKGRCGMGVKFTSESEMERSLINELVSGVSQWTYRADLKSEADLWNNFKNKLENNNANVLKEIPLTEQEFQQVKTQLTFPTFVDAAKWLAGENGIAKVQVQREDASLGTIRLSVLWREDIAGGHSSYEVVSQVKIMKNDEMDRNRRFDVSLLINGLPMIQIELKNRAHSYMDAFRQVQKYMQQGKYADAASAVKTVIDSPHALATNDDLALGSAYNKIRTTDGLAESIYSYEYNATISNGGWWPTYAFNSAATAIFGTYSIFERTYGPTNQFLNVYAANDLRIQPNQFFHWNYTNPDNGKTWTAPENACGCWFWYDEDALLNTGRSTKDRDIFRYAEALLDAAESIAQSQGVTAEAAGYLAQVKARANMEGKTVAAITADLQKLGKQAFIEECWTERLREFPLEFKIWDDCLRTGKFPVISSTEKGKVTYVDLVGAKNASGATFKSSDLLWPISLNEMQRNPSLTQNEGYAVQ